MFRDDGSRPLSDAGRQSLYAIKSWRLEGRIGVQTSADAWQANLLWDHDPAQDRLRISGPLSQGLVSIVVQKDLIFINEGDGVAELSRTPEASLRERLGFSVPLSSLRYWIMGVPDPERTYTSLPTGEPAMSGFQQAGWTIRIERRGAVGNWVLPQKMRAEGAGVKLKIVTDDWKIQG